MWVLEKQQFQIQNLSIDRMLAYRQTIDNEVNKSWIARVIRTQTVSLNLEFGIAGLTCKNLNNWFSIHLDRCFC
jgi:hypothetical protein